MARQAEKQLYLSDLLVHNINLLRNDEKYLLGELAQIANGLCGIELAKNEIGNGRVIELLKEAKDILTTYHFLISILSEEKEVQNV